MIWWSGAVQTGIPPQQIGVSACMQPFNRCRGRGIQPETYATKSYTALMIGGFNNLESNEMTQLDKSNEKGAALPMAQNQAPSFVPNAIHLVRTAQQMQLQLSQMADQKASILMGATFVSFTIAVGQVSKGGITPGLAILATFALLAAVLAIMVVMPRVGNLGPEMIDQSLLFFGAFSQVPEDEFVEHLKGRLASDDLVYTTIIRDIHQNGQVLAKRKYKYLAYAYRTFLIGLILSFFAFMFTDAPVLVG